MRILVCFKIVDDLEAVMAEDWKHAGTDAPDTGYVRRVLNCFDEAALENALLLKEAYAVLGETAEVTALTVAPGYSEHLLRGLPAVGIDRVVCVECAEDLRFAPAVTAELLAGFVAQDSPYDLVLTGIQAPPGNSGMVPLLLAESLGLPCVTDAVDFHPGKGALVVEHRVRGGLCRRTVRPPLLCTVGNARRSYLRIPTLGDKLRTKHCRPAYRTMTGTAGAPRLLYLERPEQARCCMRIEGKDAVTKATRLYELFLREALAE